MDIRLLITDVETTGFSPARDQTIEIGAVLYSVQNRTTLQSWSSLFYAPSNPAAHVNKILQPMLNEMKDVETNYDVFWRMAFSAHALVAHNAEFDRGFIRAFTRGVLVDGRPFPDLPWLCTYKSRFQWTGMTKRPVNQKLPSLAAAHDITLGGEHRALFDCNLIEQMFNKTPDLDNQIRRLLGLGDTHEGLVDQSSNNIAGA